MLTIQACVVGERMTITNSPTLASGTRETFQVVFEFDNTWNGYGKIAWFCTKSNEVYIAQVTNNAAIIPHEALADDGPIRFGVYGTSGTKRLVSSQITYTVDKGAYSNDAEESVSPTPGIIDQIEAAIGEIEEHIEAIEDDIDALQTLVSVSGTTLVFTPPEVT